MEKTINTTTYPTQRTIPVASGANATTFGVVMSGISVSPPVDFSQEVGDARVQVQIAERAGERVLEKFPETLRRLAE